MFSYAFPLIIRFMGTVCISKTDINRNRHSIFQCFPQNIVHTLHQFRCPRKPFPSWISQFHDQEFTLRCDSRINTTDTSSSVSGCNCWQQKSRAPTHPTWYNLLLPDFCRFLKCRIDLILRIFRSQENILQEDFPLYFDPTVHGSLYFHLYFENPDANNQSRCQSPL